MTTGISTYADDSGLLMFSWLVTIIKVDNFLFSGDLKRFLHNLAQGNFGHT